jgi:septal ring factor EnvC (AmiA/AmiB activator)
LVMTRIYRPRHPERTVLHRVLFHHFDRFLSEYESRFERRYGFFRPVVTDVVERYLNCGNPKCGFARTRCPDCREELQASNEELQSTNKELETSKEELQSVNKEIVTVNVELQAKIEQITGIKNDLKNLLDKM